MPDDTALRWEQRCHRCGRCCYEKVEYQGKIFLTDIPCEFLNLTTMLCNVYADRHRRKAGCVAIDRTIIKLGVLPETCAYVVDVDSYVAPQQWSYLPMAVQRRFLRKLK